MNWRELPIIKPIRRLARRGRRFLDHPGAERGHELYLRMMELRAEARAAHEEERVAHEAQLDMHNFLLRELGELRERLSELEGRDAPEAAEARGASSERPRPAVVRRLPKR
jgi:hypothetical protein